MTYEEMKAKAEAAIRPLVTSRQRGWVMKNEELTTLLITAVLATALFLIVSRKVGLFLWP
jgi:hypothetical protein